MTHRTWGARGPIVPVRHGEHAHRSIPGSRFEVFDGVGHLSQLEAPAQFLAVLKQFLAETEPAHFDREHLLARYRTHKIDSADA